MIKRYAITLLSNIMKRVLEYFYNKNNIKVRPTEVIKLKENNFLMVNAIYVFTVLAFEQS